MSQNHLVPLGNEGWTVWKWLQLRGAGFPANGALTLGSANVVAAFDCLYEAQASAVAAQAQAKFRLDELAAADAVEVAHLAKRTRTRLYKNKSLKPIGDAVFDGLLAEWNSAASAVEAEKKVAHEVLEEERIRVSKVLRSYAELPRFREAIAWQNRSVLGAAVDGYLRAEIGANNTKARVRQRLLAKYIQRYTLKNDTIGFFGPTAWGKFDADCEGFDLAPGPVIARREIFFEHWMIGTLVEHLDQNPAALPMSSLRLRLGSRIAGLEQITRDGKTTDLSELQARVLGLANATSTVGEIASTLVEDGSVASAEIVYETIRQLVKSKAATANIEIPTELPRPETWLRGLLEDLSPCEIREETLAFLDVLERDRKRVADAAGNPEALCAAIQTLEDDFQEHTSMAAKRGHGQVYAGRQIFYEECVRGGELTIGSSFLTSLASPLGLVLKSARWFTCHIGRKYRTAFTAVYKELTTEAKGPVSLMSFQIASLKHFKDETREASDIISAVQREFRRRWEQVLNINASSSSRISIRSEDCAERVEELFSAPGPGWPSARYQSPDIMLVASSADAVSRGEFEAVLGELHCGSNTLPAMTLFSLHPEKETIVQAFSSDLTEPIIASVEPIGNRAATPAIAPDTFALEDKHARSWRPRSQVLVGGDLFVEERQGVLEVVSHTTGARFDIIHFFDFLLRQASISHFSVLPRKPHMPRVTIDNLIISRERWTYKRSEFVELVAGKGTPGKGTPTERFESVSKWVRDRGLPRFVFVVVPNEPKPLYVDFASLPLVDVLLHFLAKASTLSVTETLPGQGQHWLECDQGERYASELRIVAVDPIAWTPGS